MGKVVAIVGSYRRGGITDQAVDAVLEGAQGAGAKTRKIYLVEQHIEFCDNCRSCTQMDGTARGACVHRDDMDFVLREVEEASALVLAAPVNFFNVTAIFRRFMERLVGYSYWPWGSKLGPVLRTKERPRKAVLVTSAAMPRIFIPLMTGAPRALKVAARVMGAKPVGKLWIGLAGMVPEEQLTPHMVARAMRLGRRLG